MCSAGQKQELDVDTRARLSGHTRKFTHERRSLDVPDRDIFGGESNRKELRANGSRASIREMVRRVLRPAVPTSTTAATTTAAATTNAKRICTTSSTS